MNAHLSPRATALAAVWTRDIPQQAAAGRPQIIAQLRAGPLSQAVSYRLYHAFELGWSQRLAVLWLWLTHVLCGKLLPLQCALYGAPRALTSTLRAVQQHPTVYIDGIRCLLLVRRLAHRGQRMTCDLDDLMSRRAAAQRLAGVQPSLGHVGKRIPAWLHRLTAMAGKLLHRYEEIALRQAEKEMAQYCRHLVLLSPQEVALCQRQVGLRLAQKVVCIPPMQVVEKFGAELAAPLRLIFVGGENLPQNRLTLLRLFAWWQRLQPPYELHWFGKREANGIKPPAGVICHGFVKDLAASAYDGRSILLNPAALPGGVKTKMLEALAFGCPAVGNAAAFEGVDWPEYPLILGDDDSIWEQFIVNPEAWRETLVSAITIGQNYLSRYHHPDLVGRQWADRL